MSTAFTLWIIVAMAIGCASIVYLSIWASRARICKRARDEADEWDRRYRELHKQFWSDAAAKKANRLSRYQEMELRRLHTNAISALKRAGEITR